MTKFSIAGRLLTIVALAAQVPYALAQDEAYAAWRTAVTANCSAAGDAAAKPFLAQVKAAVQSGNGEAGGAAAIAAISAQVDACKAAMAATPTPNSALQGTIR